MTSAINQEASFDSETQKNLSNWLEGAYDEKTKAEIRKLLKENPKEIADAFYTTLSFGTGGLRGILGVGSNRMNIYTVGACVQGLCDYLAKQPKSQERFSVLIGYDSRRHSREFAEEAARILAANGIKTFLYKNLRPTPLVSFGCRYKHCSAAMMFTASHNPPQYNGCKIYWNDGAQVLPPHDKNIIDEVNKITDIEQIKSVPTLAHPLIEEMDTEVDDVYYETMSKLQNCREDNQSHGGELKIVYTSLHGTGITVAPKTLARWGFTNLHFVDSQIIPDGDFPTAPSPNPEERSALSLGITKLKEINGDILIANDPDADRVGVAVMHHGSVELINGNQMVALLLEHVCEALTRRNKMPANAAFIKTVVTTELFTAITDYYQKPCFNVLPGFKYIAEKIRQWEADPRGRQFVFGGEESYGYLFGTDVRDKDAISISALICEMALQAKLKGKTLIDLLENLYHRYGIYQETLVSLTFPDTKEGKEQMNRSIELLQRRPPQKILDCEVYALEDYRRSVKIDFKTHQTERLAFPKSDVLLFWLNDGSKLVIRPSGTEPKIKIYCGIVHKQFKSIETGIQECQEHAKSLIEALQQILSNKM
ncbi:MAG: phospho-sugar mutase [Parachlamydiaceae bacterium]